MGDSVEECSPKNPLLLSPVIRCILKFLNVEEVKNCGLVCHEWASVGKVALASRSIIHLECRPGRRPADFNSDFRNTATVFSAFKISGTIYKMFADWNVEELTNFFEEHQNSIKELEMDEYSLLSSKIVDLGSWISKSPMVQKDAKHLTKLSIRMDKSGENLHVPLPLIAYIKELKLSDCRINVEAGIKISPIKLNLEDVTIFLNGVKLNRVRINDIVDFGKAKEVSLRSPHDHHETIYVVDLSGNTTLEKLSLDCCEILNGETSQWVIENLATSDIPYSLHKEMKIKALYLSEVGSIDLYTLPNSILKLGLEDVDNFTSVYSSQPIVFENLQYLNAVDAEGEFDTLLSYLIQFMNCPQLTHLKLKLFPDREITSLWLPKNVKTLTLEDNTIFMVDDNDLNLDKLIFSNINCRDAKIFCESNIHVDDVVIHHFNHIASAYVIELLEYQNTSRFCKRLFIGDLWWGEMQLESSLLKELVDVKSSFYVFEHGEKGRALSKEDFYELANVPKHIEI